MNPNLKKKADLTKHIDRVQVGLDPVTVLPGVTIILVPFLQQ
jgi:hypothetical protein